MKPVNVPKKEIDEKAKEWERRKARLVLLKKFDESSELDLLSVAHLAVPRAPLDRSLSDTQSADAVSLVVPNGQGHAVSAEFGP